MKLKKERIQIAVLADEVIASNNDELSAKKMVLVKEFSESAGSVWADRDKLTEVITNLLSNAIKYTPAGGKITLGLSGTQKEVRFEISDSGPGIAREDFRKLFDKFERLDTSAPGEGLGLAITKDIVELHKGRIWATSAPWQPNCFTILLPLAPNA